MDESAAVQARRKRAADRLRKAIQKIRTTGRLRKVLLLCGIVASLLYVITDMVAGSLYRGYSFTSQAISELSAIGAPTAPLIVPLILVYEALVIAFGLGVWAVAGQRRALRLIGALQVAGGIVGIAWMPFPIHMRGEETTFTDVMHNAFAGLVVLLILANIAVGTLAFGKRFRLYSIGTLATLLALGSLTFLVAGQLVPQQVGDWFGLFERITAYGHMAWVIVLAAVLLREERGPSLSR